LGIADEFDGQKLGSGFRTCSSCSNAEKTPGLGQDEKAINAPVLTVPTAVSVGDGGAGDCAVRPCMLVLHGTRTQLHTSREFFIA
jgi:hypothetical protein